MRATRFRPRRARLRPRLHCGGRLAPVWRLIAPPALTRLHRLLAQLYERQNEQKEERDMSDRTPEKTPERTPERTPEDIGHKSGGEWQQYPRKEAK